MDRYLEEAGNYFIKKDYKKAIEHYYKALTTNSNNIFILNKIAQCYVFLNNPDKAIFNYEKIIELEPNNIENYLNIAQVYEIKNDKNQTIEYLKQALEIEPNNIIILEMLTKLLYENEKFNEAYEYTKTRLINLKPTSANYFMFGEIAEKLNKKTEAQKYFEKAVNINPKNVDVKVVLANLLFKNGKLADAKKHLIDIFVIDSNNIDARKLLGEIFIEQNDYQKAIEEFNSVLTKKENDYDAALSKAYCYSML